MWSSPKYLPSGQDLRTPGTMPTVRQSPVFWK